MTQKRTRGSRKLGMQDRVMKKVDVEDGKQLGKFA